MVCARFLRAPLPPRDTTDGDRDKRRDRFGEFLRTVGPRLERATLDNYACRLPGQRAVLQALREYAGEIHSEIGAGNGIVLFGPSGTGKDHLLVALAKLAIKEGFSIDFRYGPDLYGEIRDRIERHDLEGPWVDRLALADVLLLSDPVPTRGDLTPHQASMLQRVLDRRYRKMRPTWVTLNVQSGREADERIGAAIVDRLKHGAVVAYCDWPSFRTPRFIST